MVKGESSVGTNQEEVRGQLGHSNQKTWSKKDENELPEDRCSVRGWGVYACVYKAMIWY